MNPRVFIASLAIGLMSTHVAAADDESTQLPPVDVNLHVNPPPNSNAPVNVNVNVNVNIQRTTIIEAAQPSVGVWPYTGPVLERTHEPRHDRGTIAVGATFASLAYLVSLLGGAAQTDSLQVSLVVPIVGPWIAVCDPRVSDLGRGALVFDGVLQVGGSLLIMAGMWRTHQVAVDRVRNLGRTWMLTPYARRDGGGLMLSVANF